MCDPAQFFGSAVVEPVEDTYKVCPIDAPFHFRNRSTTGPPKASFNMEVSLLPQDKEIKAPSIILNSKTAVQNHVNHNNIEEVKQNEVVVEKPKIEYEFGKSMYQYAKKLEGKLENHKDVPCSKSEGNLFKKKGDGNSVANSKSQQFPKKHQEHHQQCCSGFGNPSRSKYQSNACSIV